MKITDKQIKRLVSLMFDELKTAQIVSFKEKEEKVFQRALEVIKQNFEQEKIIDEEVNAMLDDLERQHPGEFQRFKMYPMLKKKIAKEKGFVL